MARKSRKPPFACEQYPKCPDREQVKMVMTEPPDEEECLPATYSSHAVTVTGPCREKCYEKEMSEPINHSVIAIINGRAVDVGS
jgi:hypothetical protein